MEKSTFLGHLFWDPSPILNSVTRVRADGNPAVSPRGSDEDTTNELARPGQTWSYAVGTRAGWRISSKRFWSQGSNASGCCEKI